MTGVGQALRTARSERGIELSEVERVSRDLGRDEMAHQQIGAARRAMGLHRGSQVSEGLEAKPVHAGVEMDRAGVGQ